MGQRRRAFSMIELVIVVVIIGIIAAIAIPRLSRGSAAAADSAMAENLQLIRRSVDLFQTEHEGVLPNTNGSITTADLLLKYSNVTATTVSSTKDPANGIIYGPYLRTVPAISVGPRKGSNGIGATDAAGIGWLYDSTTGTVTANATGSDGTGKPYSSY
jgi:prepilin-type N-terminal cleavage/methylation domain-containing protein